MHSSLLPTLSLCFALFSPTLCFLHTLYLSILSFLNTLHSDFCTQHSALWVWTLYTVHYAPNASHNYKLHSASLTFCTLPSTTLIATLFTLIATLWTLYACTSLETLLTATHYTVLLSLLHFALSSPLSTQVSVRTLHLDWLCSLLSSIFCALWTLHITRLFTSSLLSWTLCILFIWTCFSSSLLTSLNFAL